MLDNNNDKCHHPLSTYKFLVGSKRLIWFFVYYTVWAHSEDLINIFWSGLNIPF